MNDEQTLQLSDDIRFEVIAMMVLQHYYESMDVSGNTGLVEDTFEYFEHPAIDGTPSKELQREAYKAIDGIPDLITPEYIKSIGEKS